MNVDLQGVRAQLSARLEELRTASAQTKDERAPVELDQTSVGRLSRIDSLQAQAMALAADKRRHDEMRRIESALERVEAGEYGYCVQCGEEIGEARLAADATVAACIKCAK